MKTTIYNIVILDESVMIGFVKQQTIEATQKKHIETQQHFVTLVTFNSEVIKTIYDTIGGTDGDIYQPNCCTLLYDAMGMNLSKDRYSLDENVDNKILETIIRDSKENSSKEYKSEMIKKTIEKLKAKGWVFIYIGAN